jgi:sporulation protein YlmC with PRC-barrel domain
MMKNFKKDNNTGINHEGDKPNKPLKYLTVNSIMGDKVVNPEGEHMGSIKDIMINLSNGTIDYYVVEMGGFLGIGEKYFAFPFALLEIDEKNRTFVIDQELETLKNAPGFDLDHWPDTNAHEYSNPGLYWGKYLGVGTMATPY